MIPWITLWLIWLKSIFFFYVNNTESDLHIHLFVFFIRFCSLMTIHFHPFSLYFLFNFPLDFHQCLKVFCFFLFWKISAFSLFYFNIAIFLLVFQWLHNFTSCTTWTTIIRCTSVNFVEIRTQRQNKRKKIRRKRIKKKSIIPSSFFQQQILQKS